MARIAIVGCAGRKEDASKMTFELFSAMVCKAEMLVAEHTGAGSDRSAVTLVSGGAAWSDHIAVLLFLRGFVGNLELHFPCKWMDGWNPCFEGKARASPGKYANQLHKEFSTKLCSYTNSWDWSSLDQIATARKKGAKCTVHMDGFHARNTAIAASVGLLIAFSWSDGNTPKAGGTLDTWKKATSAQKIHVPLGSLIPSPPLKEGESKKHKLPTQEEEIPRAKKQKIVK